jgi:putative serine protease PepD
VIVALVTAALGGVLGGALGFAVAARTGTGPSVNLGPQDGSTPALANRAPDSVSGIATKLQPSVVSMEVTATGGQGTGSGLVISNQGHILTNNHVVTAGGNQPGDVQVVLSDGTRLPARLIGRDAASDLAVVKVERAGLPVVELGDSDKVAVGDPVVAFGSPLGLQGTVTSGIVSSLDRPVRTSESGQSSTTEDAAVLAAIQTDAPINPGNSGGPLVDGGGRVIGVNSAIATIPGSNGRGGSIGLGFAIPINQAKRIAEQLIATGRAKRTVIGAQLDAAQGADQGVRLGSITPGGPADRAGLRSGDVVTRFNGRVLSDGIDLVALIRKQAGGTSVELEYHRGGSTAKATVVLADTPSTN